MKGEKKRLRRRKEQDRLRRERETNEERQAMFVINADNVKLCLQGKGSGIGLPASVRE